jgi:hypothetical protein
LGRIVSSTKHRHGTAASVSTSLLRGITGEEKMTDTETKSNVDLTVALIKVCESHGAKDFTDVLNMLEEVRAIVNVNRMRAEKDKIDWIKPTAD